MLGLEDKRKTFATASCAWFSKRLLVISFLAILPSVVFAEEQDLKVPLNQNEALNAGEQLSFNNITGVRRFAGNTINLSDFSGIFGMSSDTAYIVVTSGRARIGRLVAKPGRVLILTPYGGRPVKQAFDAQRLLASWAPREKIHNSSVVADLKKLSKRQKRAIFFGLYQPTNFNISVPKSSNNELARRSVVGSKAVQKIRFSSEVDPKAIEKQVVSAFLNALANKDADTVASLMDPTPYGGSDLRGGADGARLLVAKRLINSKNWKQLLEAGAVENAAQSNFWFFSNGQNRISIQLRPIGDFTYITNIVQEA